MAWDAVRTNQSCRAVQGRRSAHGKNGGYCLGRVKLIRRAGSVRGRHESCVKGAGKGMLARRPVARWLRWRQTEGCKAGGLPATPGIAAQHAQSSRQSTRAKFYQNGLLAAAHQPNLRQEMTRPSVGPKNQVLLQNFSASSLQALAARGERCGGADGRRREGMSAVD
jgi:hypothetical protein